MPKKSLSQWLETVKLGVKNNIKLDRPYLDAQVSKLLGDIWKFSEEDWAHFYGSLVSNKTICAELGPNCSIEEEDGWSPLKALVLYFRVLLEVYLNTNRWEITLCEKQKELLETLRQTIALLKHRDDPTVTTKQHLAYVMQEIVALKKEEVVCLHAGYSPSNTAEGHTVYLNTKKEDNGWAVFINNLGAGYEGDDRHITTAANGGQPFVVTQRSIYFADQESLRNYLHGVILARKQSDSNLAFSYLYPVYAKQDRKYDAQHSLREFAQTTGNCSVKNLSLAVRDMCGNDEVYKQIFKSANAIVLGNRKSFGFGKVVLIPTAQDHCVAVRKSDAVSAEQSCEQITRDMMLSEVPNNSGAGAFGGTTLGALSAIAFVRLIGGDKAKLEHYALATIFGGAFGGVLGNQLETASQRNQKVPLPTVSDVCYSCDFKL